MIAKLNLPNDEWVSLAKGALVAAAGAGLTYLVQNVTATDFGTYGPIVVSLLSIFANYIRKVVVSPVDPNTPTT